LTSASIEGILGESLSATSELAVAPSPFFSVTTAFNSRMYSSAAAASSAAITQAACMRDCALSSQG
jgi:hypothetical protein